MVCTILKSASLFSCSLKFNNKNQAQWEKRQTEDWRAMRIKLLLFIFHLLYIWWHHFPAVGYLSCISSIILPFLHHFSHSLSLSHTSNTSKQTYFVCLDGDKSLSLYANYHCMVMLPKKQPGFNTVRSVPAYQEKSALTAMSCEDIWWLGENAITQKGYLPCETPCRNITGSLLCVSAFSLIRTEPGRVCCMQANVCPFQKKTLPKLNYR